MIPEGAFSGRMGNGVICWRDNGIIFTSLCVCDVIFKVQIVQICLRIDRQALKYGASLNVQEEDSKVRLHSSFSSGELI